MSIDLYVDLKSMYINFYMNDIRYLRTLKSYGCNKSDLEGFIVEGYIVEEFETFCSMYLHDVETRYIHEERNYVNANDTTIGGLAILYGTPSGEVNILCSKLERMVMNTFVCVN